MSGNLTSSKLTKLSSLSSSKISKFRIKTITNGDLIVGGFGDVRQAKLRTSIFGSDPLVAIKTLRPAGDREQRIRVVAVSAQPEPLTTRPTPRCLGISTRAHRLGQVEASKYSDPRGILLRPVVSCDSVDRDAVAEKWESLEVRQGNQS